jgi:hypothetical protein
MHDTLKIRDKLFYLQTTYRPTGYIKYDKTYLIFRCFTARLVESMDMLRVKSKNDMKSVFYS